MATHYQQLHLKEKTVLYIEHLTILCTSTATSVYWKFKDKIFNLFFIIDNY